MRSPGGPGRCPPWRSRRRSDRARSSCRGASRRTRPACGRGPAASCPWILPGEPAVSGGYPPDLGSAVSRGIWRPHARSEMVVGTPRRQPGAGVMQTTYADAPIAGSLDDQLIARLLYHRIIVLGTEVNDAVANRLCAQLLLLSAEDSRSDISLYINSPGGSVSAGLAIYDTMRLIPNDVSTLAMG